VLRRTTSFKVTPKGDDGTRDHIGSFSRNLYWAGFLGAALLVSVALHHDHPFMRAWALLGLLICLMPVLIWWATLLHQRVRTGRPATVTATTTSMSTAARGGPAPHLEGDLEAELGALAYEESSNR